MKTVIVGLIAGIIVFSVYIKIYKDYKKNKNLCGTDCRNCGSGSTCGLPEKRKKTSDIE